MHLASKAEGTDVARLFQALHLTAIVVNYRLAASGDPATVGVPDFNSVTGGFTDASFRAFAPLLDAQRALRLVRANAARWGVNPLRVGTVGFSAGAFMVRAP